MFHVKQKETEMLKVGQTEKTEITGYSSEGMGICRIDGCVVFVPNAIRGELCEIKVTYVSQNSAHGKIETILRRSPHRITRLCPDAKLCGGCQLHHMDYAEELGFKAQKVTDALNRKMRELFLRLLLPIEIRHNIRLRSRGESLWRAFTKTAPMRSFPSSAAPFSPRYSTGCGTW